MTGYVLAFAPCLVCRQPFSFNPHKVPSMKRTPDGPKEPICEACFHLINAYREKHGKPRFPPPHPEAYEAIEESEL